MNTSYLIVYFYAAVVDLSVIFGPVVVCGPVHCETISLKNIIEKQLNL